jgi:hypothetical protein
MDFACSLDIERIILKQFAVLGTLCFSFGKSGCGKTESGADIEKKLVNVTLVLEDF